MKIRLPSPVTNVLKRFDVRDIGRAVNLTIQSALDRKQGQPATGSGPIRYHFGRSGESVQRDKPVGPLTAFTDPAMRGVVGKNMRSGDPAYGLMQDRYVRDGWEADGGKKGGARAALARGLVRTAAAIDVVLLSRPEKNESYTQAVRKDLQSGNFISSDRFESK